MVYRHICVKPNYGETIFSLLSREHLLSGRTSPLISLKELTGHRGYKPLTSLPSNLDLICRNLHLEIHPEEFINKHTLFNLYRPFLAPERHQFVINGMIGTGAIKSRMGLLKSNCGAADQLAYCTECVKIDTYRHGYSYWHREHMLIGVRLCHLHRLPLTRINVDNQVYGARNLQLPGDQKSVEFWTTEQFEKLFFVAQQVSIITNKIVSHFINAKSYQPLLESLGFITASNRIRMRAIQRRVVGWLKPLSNIEVFKQLFLALDVERNWVANLVAGKEEGLHHPLKHIILWGGLETDFSSFIDTQQNCEQLILNLQSPQRKAITLNEFSEAFAKVGTASSAARILGCSINTALASMQKLGLSPKRKPKKLNPVLIEKVLNLLLICT